MSTVPSNIRVEPPRNLDDAQVLVASEFVRSILDNLLRNAIEAMPGGGEVGLDWYLSEFRRELRIVFWDTGPGLDAESVTRVLSGGGLPTHKRYGSGLGLVSVQRMVTQLGGSLALESGQPTGARWTISIPIESENE